jgi:hypothetical protein
MPNYNRLTTAQLIQAAAERVGRDAEQLALRELTTAENTIHEWRDRLRARTRDAAPMAGRSGSTSPSNYSYPPAGSSAWRSERLPDDNTPEPFQGRGLPPAGSIANPFPALGPDQSVETTMPFRYGEGGERERDVRAAQRDLGGYIQGVQRGDPNDPDEQRLGYEERAGEDFDTADDAEPIGWLSHEHQGDPEDYHLAHDPSTDCCSVFRRGQDKPIGRIRPAPGMTARDYYFSRDRKSGRLMILRRRNRDRLRQLQHEGDQIRRRPTRDRAGQERAALANLNEQHAAFWARPQSPSDFWNRRR